MKRFTLIFLNNGLEHFIIDSPLNYAGVDYSKVDFIPSMDHQFEKISEYLDKYGFEINISLLIEDGDKTDYFMLLKPETTNLGNPSNIKFEIVEPKTFRKKQIYNPTQV